MSYQLVEYVAVIEQDGQKGVVKATGVPSLTVVKKHIEQVPGVKVLRLERGEPDIIAHVERVKAELEKGGDELLTPEKVTENATRIAEEQNAETAEKAQT